MSFRASAETRTVGRPLVARRVLVVGRDPGITAVIAVGLRPRFETRTVIAISDALAQIGREPFSLIIADLILGDIDAAFSVRALAARSPGCQIIVIGSTEQAVLLDRLSGLNVYGFFTRPVDYGGLFARVSSISGDDFQPAGLAALSRRSAKVLDFLSGHYADSFDLHALARAVGVSPGNLTRAFLHDTKRSPRSFRCEVRVEVAKQILVHEDYKLDLVAEMTGFVDGSHLSRVFRVHTGRSPGQYRMNVRSPHDDAGRPIKPPEPERFARSVSLPSTRPRNRVESSSASK
jgi:AraC-like DNA-binding protein